MHRVSIDHLEHSMAPRSVLPAHRTVRPDNCTERVNDFIMTTSNNNSITATLCGIVASNPGPIFRQSVLIHRGDRSLQCHNDILHLLTSYSVQVLFAIKTKVVINCTEFGRFSPPNVW